MYWLDWSYVRGTFGPNGSEVTISSHPVALDHALRMTAIFALMPHKALFFHAATLNFGGKVWMLPGHPNAGKSTISREGGADEILSNEISILERRDDGWWALPSPFWGTGDVAQMSTAAPLEAIGILGQAKDENRWERLHGVHAIQAIMPHVGCQVAAQYEDPLLLEMVTKLIMEVPTYRFDWKRGTHPLDKSPWSPST